MDTILIKPLITEKSLKLAQNGWFSFLVNKKATKSKIAQVIEDKFNVDVVAIRTATSGDEKRTQRTIRKYYVVPGNKKAIVQLKKGQKIDLFDASGATNAEEETETKESKSLLKGTKVKVERTGEAKAKKEEKK